MALLKNMNESLRLRLLSALVMIPVLLFILWMGGKLWLILVIVCGIGCLLEWRGLCKTRQPLRDQFLLTFRLFYIIFACYGLITLRDQSFELAFNVLLLVVLFDSMAYFAGSTIKGPRLCVPISPNKTWAGFVVGVAVCQAYGFLYYQDLQWILWGGLIAVIAQAGDLFVSWLKRRAGKKDSGSLIPGHGGLLDRLAGYLAVGSLYGIWDLVG